MAIVYAVINGYLNQTPVKDVKSYEKQLFELLENKYGALLERIEHGHWDDEDIEALKKALQEMKR